MDATISGKSLHSGNQLGGSRRRRNNDEGIDTKIVFPKRDLPYTVGTITIGYMRIKVQTEKNWLIAKIICTALPPLLVEISYGSKIHFYNTIIKKG